MEQHIIEELHLAIERLADAVADDAPLAASLRRFATRLPATAEESGRGRTCRAPRDPSAIQPLLWRGLAEGVIDGQSFDVAMVTRARAAGRLARRRRDRTREEQPLAP